MLADHDTHLIRLIGQIYEAALDPPAWRDAVQAISHCFSAAVGLVISDPLAGPVSIAEAANFDPDYIRSYGEYYGRTNPWVPKFQRLPVGALLERSLVPELQLERTEFYNNWLKPQGLRDCLGGWLTKNGSQFSYIGILRPERLGDFTEHDRGRFLLVLDNLARALRLQGKLAQMSAREQGLFDALDRAGVAAFLVYEDRQIASHNVLGEALLRMALSLRSVGGTLAAAQAVNDRALDQAVRSACRKCIGQSVVLSEVGSGSPALIGLVVPMTSVTDWLARIAASPACALVLIRDPERAPQPDAETLAKVFGLTPAEAGLLRDLVAGESLEEISGNRNVHYSTVRAQLRSVMSKTDTRRQGELIALASRYAKLSP